MSEFAAGYCYRFALWKYRFDEVDLLDVFDDGLIVEYGCGYCFFGFHHPPLLQLQLLPLYYPIDMFPNDPLSELLNNHHLYITAALLHTLSLSVCYEYIQS